MIQVASAIRTSRMNRIVNAVGKVNFRLVGLAGAAATVIVIPSLLLFHAPGLSFG